MKKNTLNRVYIAPCFQDWSAYPPVKNRIDLSKGIWINFSEPFCDLQSVYDAEKALLRKTGADKTVIVKCEGFAGLDTETHGGLSDLWKVHELLRSLTDEQERDYALWLRNRFSPLICTVSEESISAWKKGLLYMPYE